MKTIFWLSTFVLIALSSCTDHEFTISTFEKEFPNKDKSLSKILGDKLVLKKGKDTLWLKIISDKKSNVVIDEKSNDTIFNGKVSKYMGRYYFSQCINDSSYLIHSVDISNNLIKGLANPAEQYFLVDEFIKERKFPKLIKYVNSDTSKIKLYTYKRESKKMFNQIMNHIEPDTILNFDYRSNAFENDTTKTIAKIDAEEYEFVKNIYPNPAIDFITVELQTSRSDLKYSIHDLNGTLQDQGLLSSPSMRINIQKFKPGIYFLSIIDEINNSKEIFKIIKLT